MIVSSEGLTQIAETFLLASLISLTLMASLGAFWMIWAGARQDDALAAILRAGFVPFSFIWYYARRANEMEKKQCIRVMRIGLTVVWTGAAIVLIMRGGVIRIVGVATLVTCSYVSYLVSQREDAERRA